MRRPPSQVDTLFYSCPVYSFVQCADVAFTKIARPFLVSPSGITFSLTMVLILLACRAAPRSWQDKPVTARSLQRKGERRWRWWREGRRGKGQRLPQTPAGPQRLLLARGAALSQSPPRLWSATFLIGGFWVFTTLIHRPHR
jgi:hypothetical protein